MHDEQDYGQEKPLLGQPAVAPEAVDHVSGPDDLATILFTSGTTGRPRGVMLSQRNLASNAAAMADALGSGGEHTRLNILPLSHIYARTCDLYTWIYRGSRLVLARKPRDAGPRLPARAADGAQCRALLVSANCRSRACERRGRRGGGYCGRVWRTRKATLLRRGGARAGRRGLVRGAGPADPAGLRADRGVAGDLGVDAHRAESGLRRPAARRESMCESRKMAKCSRAGRI